jgi:hypothetical protein
MWEMTRLVKEVVVTTVLSVTLAACSDNFDTSNTIEPYTSFGGIVYREGCQRVAYTGQLAQQAAGERTTVDVSGSLGRAVCVNGSDPPADSPDKLKAIVGQKDLLIATVDLILPKPFLNDLEGFLEAIAPLDDDGTMPTAISSLGALLDIMYKDPDFTPALARLANRVGYRPTKTAAGLVHTVVEYPGIDDFLTKTLALIAPGGTAETEFKTLNQALSMELRSATPVANPNDPERTLRLALNLLYATHADLSSGTPLPLVSRDYRGIAQASTTNGAVNPPFVDVNPKDGLADVDNMGHYVDANGNPLTVATPFAEAGVADAAPRDTLGRALSQPQGTNLLYTYLDLDSTVIAGLNREAVTLMDPMKDTSLGLVFGASALLGPRASQTKMYMDPAGGMLGALTYNGFDTSQSAVLDLLHAFIQLLGDPNIDPTLETASTLMSQYESPAARAIGAMLDASDRGKLHPEAQIPPTSNLYDDLMPIVVRVLRVPGLAQDVLKAMTDPRITAFAPMVARLMTADNQVDFDHSNAPTYPLLDNLSTIQPVDRTKPDTDYNRSLMQRIAHLIHDANGTQFCNKQGATVPLFGTYNKCDLFQVDDLGLLYVTAMSSVNTNTHNAFFNEDFPQSAQTLSNFCDYIKPAAVKTVAPAIIEGSALGTGINGFTCTPSPHALNVSLFLTASDKAAHNPLLNNTTDDITCSDTDKFIDVHNKSIFAWEAPMATHPEAKDFYDAVQPLVDAFVLHDECIARDPATNNCTKTQNAGKIFVDLFATLHTHYGSPQSTYFGHSYQATNPAGTRFAHLDNVVSYEPLLTEVLGQADLVPSIIGLTPTLISISTDGTPVSSSKTRAQDALVATAQYLLDPVDAKLNGVAYRDGSTSTVMSDGMTPVPQATPYYLLADAFAHKRAALAAATMQQSQSWKSSTSNLVDQMLTVVKNGTGYQLQNRRIHAITLVLIDFLRSRLTSHAKAGDVITWTHQTLTQNLTDILGGPVFAALTDFTAKVESDPDARTQLYGLLSYLVDEANNDAAFQVALTTLADQVQTFMDDPNLVPVAHVLGSAVDPTTNTVNDQLTLVKKSHDLDVKRALLTVLRNLYQQNAMGGYPASDLADILSELNRAHPGMGGPLAAEDYKSILGEVRDFLLDDQRGFTRFLDIVKARGPH